MRMLCLIVGALVIAGCEKQEQVPAPKPVVPAAPAVKPDAPKPAAPEVKTDATKPAAPEAKPETKPEAPKAAATVDGQVKVGELTFPLPKGWMLVASTSVMRLAECRVPGEGGADCTVAFFVLGGTAQQNIDRWAGMVLGPDGKPATPVIAVREVNGLKVHTVEMTGTYQEGMGGVQAARADWMFRGAVIETMPQHTFIRMTGPKGAMAAAGAGWETLIAGVKGK